MERSASSGGMVANRDASSGKSGHKGDRTNEVAGDAPNATSTTTTSSKSKKHQHGSSAGVCLSSICLMTVEHMLIHGSSGGSG